MSRHCLFKAFVLLQYIFSSFYLPALIQKMYDIIKALGGEIGAETKEGAEFIIKLPEL